RACAGGGYPEAAVPVHKIHRASLQERDPPHYVARCRVDLEELATAIVRSVADGGPLDRECPKAALGRHQHHAQIRVCDGDPTDDLARFRRDLADLPGCTQVDA